MSTNETLSDMVYQLESSLATANDALGRIKTWRNTHIAAMGGMVPMPSSPVLPKPAAAIPAPSPALDSGPFPGEGNPAVRQVIREAAQVAGIHPAVLEAIEVWETGHYRDPNAKAWLLANNPGGMKSTSVTQALGQVGTEGPYAAFPTWQTGIRAHGGFLRQARYDAARAADADVATQVHGIWAAGYSEMDPDWLANVTAIAIKLEGAYGISATRSSTSSGVGSRIVAAAHSIVGHPTGPNDPVFTYAPETEGGNLGCADAVSTILVKAGVLPSILLSVQEVADKLLSLGWHRVADHQDGDVIVWAATSSSGGHQHIGVTYVANGAVHAINNSSSHRHVEDLVLSQYDRPIAYVLRAPVA